MGKNINFKFKKFAIVTAALVIGAVVFVVISYWGFGLQKNSIHEAAAGISDNTSGYAWSENIGWISFNCTDGGTCPDVDYGVNVDNNTGAFSGYAWSENIGWIKFDPVGPYPEDPPTSATLDLVTYEASGWARACAGAANPDCSGGANPDSGGWDGWIKMRDDAQEFGVSWDSSTKEFSGFAWGSDVIGWVSFNCSNDHDPDIPGTQSVCGTSNYKVIGDINREPTATDLSAPAGDYCTIPSHVFSWTFSDPDTGDSQSAYDLEVDDNADFSSPEVAVSGGSSPSHTVIVAVTPGANQLAYNTSYNWRVKVFDENGADSGWVSPNPSQSPFTTEQHLYPDPDFTFSPSAPSQDEEIVFSETTTCYDIANNAISCPVSDSTVNYAWDFDYEAPLFTEDATGQVVSMAYSDTDKHTIALDVTDAESNTCRGTQDIKAKRALPKFRETAPGS